MLTIRFHPDNFPEQFHTLWIEPRGGLVQDQKLGVPDQRDGEGQAVAFPWNSHRPAVWCRRGPGRHDR